MILNKAESEGGVISGYTSIQLSMDRCLLRGNKAARGGGLGVKNCKLKISNSKFIKNEAIFHGGAIYVRGDSSCNISNSHLLQNNAQIGGGALFITTNVTLIGSDINFRRNTCIPRQCHLRGNEYFHNNNCRHIQRKFGQHWKYFCIRWWSI